MQVHGNQKRNQKQSTNPLFLRLETVFFFFFGEKFIWSFRKCIYYLVHVHVNAANQKLIGKLSRNFSRSNR